MESTLNVNDRIRFWFEVESKTADIKLDDLMENPKHKSDLEIQFADNVTGQKESKFISRSRLRQIKTIRLRATRKE